MAKRKNNVGHNVEQHWVFGMYDVHQGIGVLEFIPDKTKAILFFYSFLIFYFRPHFSPSFKNMFGEGQLSTVIPHQCT